jgi:UDP-galactopyranose mutase
MTYDFLIVGAGWFGSTFARLATDAGKKCLIIDKRNHIAGNAYTQKLYGIDVHVYGPHMFHTNNERIWEFVNKFSEFIPYKHTPVAFGADHNLYPLPFTMNTFHRIWGISDPEEAKAKIDSQKPTLNGKPKNLEEQAIQMVGTDLYELLIKEYTAKQWNTDPKNLPASIIRRLPVRFDWETNYFGDDRFCGVPKNGYTELFEHLLKGVDIKLNVDYHDHSELKTIADVTIYTGGIDRFYDYCFGELEYRSLRFEHEILNMPDYQSRAIVNYCTKDVSFTRLMEHKHFTNAKSDVTIITKEYPQDWNKTVEPYYPIASQKNKNLYDKYYKLSKMNDRVIFGGRLGEYQYYDMHQVVGSAMSLAKRILN